MNPAECSLVPFIPQSGFMQRLPLERDESLFFLRASSAWARVVNIPILALMQFFLLLGDYPVAFYCQFSTLELGVVMGLRHRMSTAAIRP